MEERSITVVNADTILHSIESSLQKIQQCVISNSDWHSIRETIKKVIAELSKFEDNPKLVDTKLESLVLQITLIYLSMKRVEHTLTSSFTEIFYQLTKIRGYKFVVNFCSNDIYLVPDLLRFINEENIEKADYECFMLLLWLSRLAIVPFPLLKVIPHLEDDLFAIALKFLTVHSNASRTQISSLYLLASLVTRLDCVSLLNRYIASLSEDWPYKPSNEKVGHLLVINKVMKNFSNIHVSRLAPQIHLDIIDYDILQLRHNEHHQLSFVHVLYLIKVISKLARYYVQKNNFEKVSDIVNCVLIDIMDGMGAKFDTKLRECTAKNMTKIATHLLPTALNYSSQLSWFMVDQLNIAVFPKDHRYHQHLTIDSSNVRVDKYHTVLLFLGFSTLSKNISVGFMPSILSIVHQTLFISESTFLHVKGTQIRDASCFCLWALFKKLNFDGYTQVSHANPAMMLTVFTDILKVIIFDSDFTIRRCGIAVLQEFVGRFGNIFFQELLPGRSLEDIGDFSIKFIEKFSAGAVGSLGDSHEMIYELHSMGFPKILFLDCLLWEIVCDRHVFETRKLGAIYLAGILKRRDPEITLAKFSLKQRSVSTIIDSLINAYSQGNNECLYALAELSLDGLFEHDMLSFTLGEDYIFHFDHHHGSSERSESILHWINSLLSKACATTDSYLRYVLPIALAGLTPGLRSEMRRYFELVSNDGLGALELDQLLQIFQQISRGNNLLAEGIMSYFFNDEQVDLLVLLMTDFNVSPETRSLLINGAENLIAAGFSYKIIDVILINLDDYTVTEQGDIGQKLRSSCLSLLKNNIELARLFPSELKKKLVRLSGETMDRLRGDSFLLMCALQELSEYETNYSSYMSNYNLYFGDLFHYYKNHAQDREEFWRGIVHSAGASTGSNMLINTSVRQVLAMLYYSNEADSNEIMTNLFRLLKLALQQTRVYEVARYQKTVNCTLNLIGKIFDAEVKLPVSTNYEALYIRAFNLHISGVNLKRMGLVLKVFQHMSTSAAIPSVLRQKSRQRVCWLACLHKNNKVRTMARKTLFEIVNDLSPEHEMVNLVDKTDWFGETNATKLQLERKFALL